VAGPAPERLSPPASTTSPNSAELHASVPILKSRTVSPQENVAQVTSPNEFWYGRMNCSGLPRKNVQFELTSWLKDEDNW